MGAEIGASRAMGLPALAIIISAPAATDFGKAAGGVASFGRTAVTGFGGITASNKISTLLKIVVIRGARPLGLETLHLLDVRLPAFLVGAGPVLHGFWIVENRTVCRVERKHALRFPGNV